MTSVLAIALILVGCTKSNPPAETVANETASVEPATCGSIKQLHTVGDIYLAGQPSKEDFALLKERGVKTIINLRLPQEMNRLGFDEKTVVEELGMTYAYLPWSGADQLTDERLDAMRQLLRESERPLMLHCASSNRVGAGWLAYRVLDEGVPAEQAVAEAKTIGMRTPAYESITLKYIGSR